MTKNLESQAEVEKQTPMWKYAVVGGVALVTVAGLLGLSFYLGGTLVKDAHESSWRVYKDMQGRVVEEKITKTDDAVDVNMPNSMEIVYDYTHGMTFRRYTDAATKKRSPCYATYLDDGTSPTPDSQFTDSSEMVTPTEDPTVEEHWQFTNSKVPAYMSSLPEVQAMCEDTDIYWMQKTEASQVKREDYKLAYVGYLSWNGYYNGVYGTFFQLYYLIYDAEGTRVGTYTELYFRAL